MNEFPAVLIVSGELLEDAFVTAERATHPDIQQGRFKLRQRNPA